MSVSITRVSAGLLAAFVATVAAPGAGVYVHSHAGGNHAHVHSGDHDHDGGDPHRLHRVVRRHARLPGVRRARPAAAPHVHAQASFQRAAAPSLARATPLETVHPVVARRPSHVRAPARSRPRSRGPPGLPG